MICPGRSIAAQPWLQDLNSTEGNGKDWYGRVWIKRTGPIHRQKIEETVHQRYLESRILLRNAITCCEFRLPILCETCWFFFALWFRKEVLSIKKKMLPNGDWFICSWIADIGDFDDFCNRCNVYAILSRFGQVLLTWKGAVISKTHTNMLMYTWYAEGRWHYNTGDIFELQYWRMKSFDTGHMYEL